jgi:3-deoxy-D-manno-octulosonate 8-phosphate phosphatase (KDO 8-P phosphatase)
MCSGVDVNELFERAAKIKLLLMDVDGVMTDGALYQVPAPAGGIVETKGFNSQDGIALRWLAWNGIDTGVISGRVSPATEERCRQVECKYVYQGHVEKIPLFEEILEKSGLAREQVCFAGDDLTDVAVMRRAGLAVATANARPEVKRFAHLVTEAPGGHGAIREVCELLLKAQGHWDALLRKYEAYD